MDPKSLGDKIDRAYELREKKRKLEAEVKRVNEKIQGLEHDILALLADTGITTARASQASATITEQVVPVVEDFDQALNWIKDNDAFYMLQRRISSAAYKELLATGDEVPGVSPYTKRTISLRKLS